MTDGQFLFGVIQIMKKYSNITVGIAAGIIFLIIYNLSAFAFQCNEIRNDTIRLHVIANSDTAEDQEIKLKVRDALLASGKDIFNGTVTPLNAQSKILKELKNLENTANEILRQNGKNYTAKVNLTTEYFSTRTYDNNITLPAGKYLALKVILGDGVGQNWWCVMFPTLCLPATAKTNKNSMKNVYTESQKYIMENNIKYEIQFRIIEVIERMKNGVDN